MDFRGVATRLKFAWAETALLITVACGGGAVVSGQNHSGGMEGQTGQPTQVSPDISPQLYLDGTPDAFDAKMDQFFGTNVNVPQSSDIMQISGDQTYKSVRAVRVDAADLSIDYFMAQKSDGDIVSMPVRWLKDQKTGEMVGYAMQVDQYPDGKKLLNYVPDGNGSSEVVAKGTIVNGLLVLTEIKLPGQQNFIDITKLGNILLGADPGLGQVNAAESTVTAPAGFEVAPKTPTGIVELVTATQIATEVPKRTAAPTLPVNTEVAEFSVDPDVTIPAELGTPAIAVRWGPEGSFTISTKEGTPYTLVSPVGERPIFDTPKGKEFFFGLLAKAFGYENADDYLKAVSSGEAKTITLPQFGIQEGPVVLDPAKVSIVFEATEVNDPDRVWFLGRLESHARKTGGWIRWFSADTPKENFYYRFDINEDGRVVIRIRTPKSLRDSYDLAGQIFNSYLISQGVYMFAVMATNDGKFPGPPSGFGEGIWPSGDTVTVFSSFSSDGTPKYETFYETTFAEFLGVEFYKDYTGSSDLVVGS